MNFSQTFSNVKVYFVTFSWFFDFSRLQGCVYWLSSRIRSGVIAGHILCAKLLAGAGLKTSELSCWRQVL